MATILDAVVTAAQQAVGIVSPFGTKVTYTHVAPGAYNPTSDTQADGETVYSNVTCILVDADEAELDSTPVTTDTKKAIIAYNDMPIVPTLSDFFTLPDGTRYEVIKIKIVPGRPVHILYVEGC